MTDVTRILSSIQQGDSQAAEQLLPLVYQELRQLAARKLALEKPGQTLQATALVHEAYLRLVENPCPQSPEEATPPGAKTADAPRGPEYANRRHFFAAAAEAMRRILIESARRKGRQKRGGDLQRVELNAVQIATHSCAEDLLALDDALESLARSDPQAAQLVKLRYFTGVSFEEAAEMAGLARATGYEHWSFARAWLRCHLRGIDDAAEP